MNTSNTPTIPHSENDVNRVNLNSKETNEWLDACSEDLEANQMDELWFVE